MYFDWITWSIWLVGFAVMVTWIFVPVKEYKMLLEKRKKFIAENAQKNSATQLNETKLTEKQ